MLNLLVPLDCVRKIHKLIVSICEAWRQQDRIKCSVNMCYCIMWSFLKRKSRQKWSFCQPSRFCKLLVCCDSTHGGERTRKESSQEWRQEKRREKWRQWRPPLKTGLVRFRVGAKTLLIKTLQKETSNPCAPLHNSQTSCGTWIAFQFKGTFPNTYSSQCLKTPLNNSL